MSATGLTIFISVIATIAVKHYQFLTFPDSTFVGMMVTCQFRDQSFMLLQMYPKKKCARAFSLYGLTKGSMILKFCAGHVQVNPF